MRHRSQQPRPAPVAELGCAHYKRKCALLAPCCNTYFTCRFCHDAEKYEAVLDPKKLHRVDRHAVTTIKCLACGRVQPSQQTCEGCGVCMGAYYCSICNFFDDDTSKGQWHCDECGICRVGGKSKFFHCSGCNTCLSLSTRESHTCKADKLRTNCFLCLEDIFSSRDAGTMLRCGHAMHTT